MDQIKIISFLQNYPFMKKIIIMGPPGSGKGTQSAILSRHLKIPHISSGDMMREIVKTIEALPEEERNEMQVELLYNMKNGKLVKDEVICNLVLDKLKNTDGFILDGFPRNLKQAKLINQLAEVIIYINTDFNECIKRILNRGEGRVDDKLEIAEERIKIYSKETLPAINYFKNKWYFNEVDGNKEKHEITERILKIFQTENIK